MANTVQHKRGTTAQVNSYTGAVGEFIYNTTTKRIHAQDGVTAGGIPHALVSDVDLKANASVTISSGAGLTGGGTLAANRTLALSSASIASLALADSAVQSVNGKSGSSVTLTKDDVGLSNVDNTSDANKPISTATQTALNAKANSSVTITAGAGLTGGGNLTANRTVALNAASIASLGKADTALQAPGGTAGQILAKNSADDNDVSWVTSEAATAVSYGPQTLTDAQQGQARQNIQADKSYDSIASVASATVPAFANAIRTNGYYAAGDGGGALYKRVASEPSHAGKVQSADGAWWEIDMRNGVNVLQFGAKGDGSGDDTAAIQGSYDALNTFGGILRIPRGRYPVTSLMFTQRATDWHSNRRVSVIGDGSGLVTFRYIGAPGGIVVTWDTDLTENTDNTGRNSWTKVRGFCVEGANQAATGLRVVAKSWFMMDDIRIIQCTTHCFKFDGTLSWSGRALRSYGGQYGFYIERSDDPRAMSMPNNVNLYDITVGNSTKWGMYIRNPGPINIFGGSVESNGLNADTDSGGIYVIRNDAGIGIEGTALNIKGVYFERNGGRADILLAQQSNTYKMAANIDGCIFNRMDGTKFTTNNIHSQPVGSATLSVDIDGCSFSYAGSYTPDAGRRCISIGGDLPKMAALNVHSSNVFLSSVDNWSDLNGPWVLPSGSEFASGRVGADGVIARRKNVSNVVKQNTGQYRINFNYPAASEAPQVVATTVGSGYAAVAGISSSHVTIQTYSNTGVATDQQFNFLATNA